MGEVNRMRAMVSYKLYLTITDEDMIISMMIR
jgi:hypothetical protein